MRGLEETRCYLYIYTSSSTKSFLKLNICFVLFLNFQLYQHQHELGAKCDRIRPVDLVPRIFRPQSRYAQNKLEMASQQGHKIIK